MTIDTFEQYLQQQFGEQEPQVLDDDLPDAFDQWVTELDVETLIIYGDAYARYFAGQTLKEMQAARKEAA